MLPFQHIYLNIQKFQGPAGRGQHDENLLEYDCTVLGAGGGVALGFQTKIRTAPSSIFSSWYLYTDFGD